VNIQEDSMQKSLMNGVIAAAVCSFAIGVSAQTTGQPPSPQTRPSSQSASDSITVTGCLQRDSATATPGATGTSGSAATASKSDTKFVLNVSPSSSTAGTAGSTAGTAGSSSAATASSYKLDADDAKLTPHVGHKVEITGTVDKSSSSSTAGGTTAGGTTAGGTTAGAASSTMASNAPKLKVDSVRMIASSCSN
jgi:hypothetical protein